MMHVNALLLLAFLRISHVDSLANVAVIQREKAQSTVAPGSFADFDTPEARAKQAQALWTSISTAPVKEDISSTTIDLLPTKAAVSSSNDTLFSDTTLSKPAVTLYHSLAAYREFCELRGTYYINGLSSCKLGKDNGKTYLLHPFETHGYCKSLRFEGDGAKGDGTGPQIRFNNAIIQTPLTKLERWLQRPLARGVMNRFGGPSIVNALSPSTRNTANLVTTVWPLPTAMNDKTGNWERKATLPTKQLLIVGGDNGTPWALDPDTLQTLGPLHKHVPNKELAKILREHGNFLAHTRIDKDRQRLVMLASKFDIPGDDKFKGNTQLTFIEIDSEWNVVSTRSHRDQFMIVHDWMMTPDYYIVPLNPAKILYNKLLKFITGSAVGVEIFKMQEEVNSGLIIIPRNKDNDTENTQPAHVVQADSHFSLFHFGPCIQHDDNENGLAKDANGNGSDAANMSSNSQKLTIYASIFDQYQYGNEMGYFSAHREFDPIAWSSRSDIPAPRLDKFEIELTNDSNDDVTKHGESKKGRLLKRERIPVVDQRPEESQSNGNTVEDIPIDMPTFSRYNSRYSYFSGAYRNEGWFPFHSVVKTDLLTKQSWNWDAGPFQMVSEVHFIPRPQRKGQEQKQVDEDDGFVISIIHEDSPERQECALMVWDSKTFEKGPMARISLGKLFPWCVHGTWVADYNNHLAGNS